MHSIAYKKIRGLRNYMGCLPNGIISYFSKSFGKDMDSVDSDDIKQVIENCSKILFSSIDKTSLFLTFVFISMDCKYNKDIILDMYYKYDNNDFSKVEDILGRLYANGSNSLKKMILQRLTFDEIDNFVFMTGRFLSASDFKGNIDTVAYLADIINLERAKIKYANTFAACNKKPTVLKAKDEDSDSIGCFNIDTNVFSKNFKNSYEEQTFESLVLFYEILTSPYLKKEIKESCLKREKDGVFYSGEKGRRVLYYLLSSYSYLKNHATSSKDINLRVYVGNLYNKKDTPETIKTITKRLINSDAELESIFFCMNKYMTYLYNKRMCFCIEDLFFEILFWEDSGRTKWGKEIYKVRI